MSSCSSDRPGDFKSGQGAKENHAVIAGGTVFQREDFLGRFHETVSREAALSSEDYEGLYIDDGSSDGTLAVLKKLAAEDTHTRYLSFSRNFGKESAMLAGLRHAVGDMVIIMDADLQHPPELIQRMLDLRAQGFDQVIARRTRARERVTRVTLSRLYYWLINKWIDVELIDGVGDFRLLTRRAVDAVLSLQE